MARGSTACGCGAARELRPLPLNCPARSNALRQAHGGPPAAVRHPRRPGRVRHRVDHAGRHPYAAHESTRRRTTNGTGGTAPVSIDVPAACQKPATRTDAMSTTGTPLMWTLFAAFVLVALARRLLRHGEAGSAQGLDEGGRDLVAGLGGRVVRVRRLALVAPRRTRRQRGRRREGARVHHRLPRREGAGGGQHLRVPDGVHVLRGARRVPEAGADVRHPGRARAARRDDPGRRVADRAVPLDPVPVRRVPGVHRHQDVARDRAGAGPGGESRR